MVEKKWFERCPACKSDLLTTKATITLSAGKGVIKDVEMQYCSVCKQEFFTPEQVKKLDKLK